jgi:magnesium transporter
MVRFGKRFAPPGTAPGTLSPPAFRRVETVTISVLEYGPDRVTEWQAAGVEEVASKRAGLPVLWIDVVGLHDVDLIGRLGGEFGLHPLALEDVLNTGQRPKMEPYEDHIFMVMKLMHSSAGAFESEQISFFLGTGFVISFQEIPGDVFEPVRQRIRTSHGRIRRMGPDYLAYALLDSLVDHCFPVLEEFGERIEELEQEVIEAPDRETVGLIHAAKRDLLVLRRATWPQREVVSALERYESPLVSKEIRIFLRDLYDHTVQVLDMVETYRDLVTGLLDIYLSSVSNRMNEVMKVLTVLASIFIPLTFLAGIYGMNFDPKASPWNMPELEWAYGYPAFWLLTVAIVVVMLILFKRKRWL